MWLYWYNPSASFSHSFRGILLHWPLGFCWPPWTTFLFGSSESLQFQFPFIAQVNWLLQLVCSCGCEWFFLFTSALTTCPGCLSPRNRSVPAPCNPLRKGLTLACHWYSLAQGRVQIEYVSFQHLQSIPTWDWRQYPEAVWESCHPETAG